MYVCMYVRMYVSMSTRMSSDLSTLCCVVVALLCIALMGWDGMEWDGWTCVCVCGWGVRFLNPYPVGQVYPDDWRYAL